VGTKDDKLIALKVDWSGFHSINVPSEWGLKISVFSPVKKQFPFN
jgi:hypothetical protein